MIFSRVSNLEAIEQWIERQPIALLYITQENCSVCHALRPKIEALLEEYPKIEAAESSVNEIPELAGKFSVFTAPVIILFVDGKEYTRDARSIFIETFKEKIDKIYTNYF